ncbi:hypothetical protein KP626_00235 [Christensenella sp. MSJ-20]|uniref:hypothetical protein n=1 Tax=Christensenella sp. MSJ-20 TaxID=2841518 RepID=UPI001C7685F9|nr:hypothetical protein KP626_00235 [Christensenella sp. MSJ-20]
MQSRRAYRPLAILFAFVLMAVMAPMTVFAGGETVQITSQLGITQDTDDATLQAQSSGALTIAANGDGTHTVTVLKDISSSALIQFGVFDYTGQGGEGIGADQPYLILDLNGHTITGTSIVIANLGNLIIRDTSEGKTGRIVFDNPSGYLVAIQNAGYNLKIEGGTFVCNGAGSASYNAVVSTTAPSSQTVIDGGTFDGGNGPAIKGYGTTVINGGTLKGAYGAVTQVSAEGHEGSILFPADSDAVVEATKFAFVATGHSSYPEKTGTVTVEGGSFDAPVLVGRSGVTAEASEIATVTGGTYTIDPSGLVPATQGTPVAKVTLGSDSAFAVGQKAIEEQMEHAGEGDKVDVLSGDVQLGGLPDGVTVTNSGAGDVTVNGNPVTTDPVISHTHAWGEPVWAWAADHSGATATFTCTKDSSHQEIVAATIGSETEAASCTADGKTVYTATAAFGGKTYTDVQTVTIPAKHQFKDGVCAVCGAADPAYDTDIPQMGDEGNLALWTSLLLLGGMAAVGMAFFLRRKAAR